MAPRVAALVAASLLVGAAGCARLRQMAGSTCAPYEFALPPGVGVPAHPAGTCLTPARVSLGRRLFYDRRLSANSRQSCAGCHLQQRAFTDGRRRAVGSTGQVHPRNAQSLTNVAFRRRLTWADPMLRRLDKQTLIPFFSEDTDTTIVEFGITNKEWIVTARLRKDPHYLVQFRRAFPGSEMTITDMARALAAFQATLLSYRSPYDRGVMSESARRGERLFRSARAGCSSCHGGIHFNIDRTRGQSSFQNVGLYNVRGKGDYPDAKLHGRAAGRANQGLFAATKRPGDRGRYRTPSLRNVGLTAPYMHDGSIATLAGVIEHFNHGGRHVRRGPLAGDGRRNSNKDSRIRPLGLNRKERRDLLAFLYALSDDCFITDPRYSDPSLPPPKQPAHCK